MRITGALDGIVVADFSRVLAGPYATMMLADFGAEVIKVERPGVGDDTRAWGPPFAPDGQSTYYHSVNRNKTVVEWDLKNDEHRALAFELIDRADVFIENFMPGTAEALGFGYDALHARNSRLIYCSISGFGTQAGASLPGYDLLAQATSGLMSITGTSEPTKAGVALVDVLTGSNATIGILAALHAREATGEGQHVEVSLLSSAMTALVNQASGYVGAGVVPTFMGNDHPSITPYGVYEASDRSMIIGAGNDAQFRKLCEVIGIDVEPRFATNTQRVGERDALRVMLNEHFAKRTADEWQVLLTDVGVPCGPINSISQAYELAERLGFDPIVTFTDGNRTTRNPIEFSATPVTYRSSPPKLPSRA